MQATTAGAACSLQVATISSWLAAKAAPNDDTEAANNPADKAWRRQGLANMFLASRSVGKGPPQ
jgi:hypothetical protein